jgi:hypothetical protein
MTTTEPLTEREQRALEQMREAQEQGSTLKKYAAKIGLDVRRYAWWLRHRRRAQRLDVPAVASGRLGARVRWTAAGLVDRSGVGRRCACCALVHET